MQKVEIIRNLTRSTSLRSSASGIAKTRGFWISFLQAFADLRLTEWAVFSKPCAGDSMRRLASLFLLVIGVPLAAYSAEVLDSWVTKENERYIMHTETVVQAPISNVRALIMDYRNFPRLNTDIKRVEAMQNLDDGGIRMGVRSSVCILAICQHFDWVQDIRFLPEGDITMTIVPNEGDFREGNGRWRLQPIDGGTRLFFDIALIPRYWVPPLFGSWVMKQKLTEEAYKFAQGLEEMANSNCC